MLVDASASHAEEKGSRAFGSGVDKLLGGRFHFRDGLRNELPFRGHYGGILRNKANILRRGTGFGARLGFFQTNGAFFEARAGLDGEE